MPKQKLYIAYDSIQDAQEAQAALGRAGPSWASKIETATIEGQTRYLIDSKNGECYDVLFKLYSLGKQEEYSSLKQQFTEREHWVSEEDMAIAGWNSAAFEQEPKISLRRLTKEYKEVRQAETGQENKTSDYYQKRDEYLLLGGTLLTDE